MSSRPIAQFPVIVDGDMSGDLVSKVSIITNLTVMTYGITWSGTAPVGVMSAQVSNDYSINADGSVRNPGTWDSIPLTVPANVTGNTGSGTIALAELGSYALRIIYTRTSGTGTMQAIFSGKVE